MSSNRSYILLLGVILLSLLLAWFYAVKQIVPYHQQQLELQSEHLVSKLSTVLPPALEINDKQALGYLIDSELTSVMASVTLQDSIAGTREQWQSAQQSTQSKSLLGMELTSIEQSVLLSRNGIELATLTVNTDANDQQQRLNQEIQRLLVILQTSMALLTLLVVWLIRQNSKTQRLLIDEIGAIRAQTRTTDKSDVPGQFEEVFAALSALRETFNKIVDGRDKELNSLRRNMMYDDVSGLPNRQFFNHQLKSWFHKDESSVGAILLVRLEWLNHLHASLGYEVRDQTWKILASRLTSDDEEICIARMSHDEIAILLPEVSEESARHYLHGLLRLLNQEMTQAGFQPNENIHIGAAYGYGGDTQDLLSCADQALQTAIKTHAVFIFESMQQDQLDQSWNDTLQDALNSPEFNILQQPVVKLNAQTSTPYHSEIYSQLRVNGEWLSAGKIMPYLAAFGLGADFDKASIKSLFTHLRTNPLKENESLAINLTEQSIADESFVQWLSSEIKGINYASQITFELSEAAVRSQLASCLYLAEKVRSTGASIGVDHFGRYLQSVDYLTKLRPCYVKLDQAFGQNDGLNRIFIETLASNAESLDVFVIATGIEDAYAIEKLDSSYIFAFQGFINPPKALN